MAIYEKSSRNELSDGAEFSLNHSPAPRKLQKLIASADDRAGRHILWVSDSGTVKLSLLPDHTTPDYWTAHNSNLRLRFESFGPDHGWVGPAAAADANYVQQLFSAIVKNWGGQAKGMIAWW